MANEAELVQLEEHIENCPQCQATLAREQEAHPIAQALSTIEAAWAERRQTIEQSIPEDYRLIAEVARGGQGVVYKAVQVSTNRPVAIKMLLLGLWSTTEQRERMDREAQLIARLNHPHIVRVYRSSASKHGVPFLVMEWIQGQDLNKLVQSRRELGHWYSLPNVLDLFDKIASAIQAAHAAQVLHRDLKPSNVLVDEHNEPHVVDFGLGKLIVGEGEDNTRVSATGAFLGSLPWASPEQCNYPASLDVRTDIHGLALILYFMLTGQLANGTIDSIAALVDRITRCPPTPPSKCSCVGPISPELDAVVMRALSKEPITRYASVAEMRAALWASRQAQKVDMGPPLGLAPLLALVLLCLVSIAEHLTLNYLLASSQRGDCGRTAAFICMSDPLAKCGLGQVQVFGNFTYAACLPDQPDGLAFCSGENVRRLRRAMGDTLAHLGRVGESQTTGIRSPGIC
jgi:serine/threonine protein kinase